MVRFVDGKLVEVPDDERITPDLVALRDAMTTFLQWLSSPEAKAVERQYRESWRTSALPPGFWYPSD